MICDFHTHSFFSDGELLPTELIRRAQCNGYRVIGITDHASMSNIAAVSKVLLKTADWRKNIGGFAACPVSS